MKATRRLVLEAVMFHLIVRRGVSAFSVRRPSSSIRPLITLSTAPSSSTLLPTRSIIRLHSTKRDAEDQTSRKKRKKNNKFTINKTYDPQQADKLAAAFDALARKEGFDAKTASFADDETFEDDFDDDFLDDDDDLIDPESLKLSDFKDDEDEDDFLDFGSDEDGPMSMEDRIAAAKRDMDLGRVSVPEELDTFARDVSPRSLRELGFRREVDPFEGDETHRRDQYKLETKALVCPACGSNFQCSDEKRPGFLPAEKYAIQVKLSKIEEMQQLQTKADSEEWSTDDEIDWLLQTSGNGQNPSAQLENIDIDALAEKLGIDLDKHLEKNIICKRCHGLQNHGKVEEALRPGWSEDPLLAQEKFRELLRPLANKNAVIIALVDLFDFAGSVLPELDNVAGDNPVIVAANKADLLPEKMGPVRVENWVRRELEYLGVQSLANIGGAVRLVSCRTGKGVMGMLEKAKGLAEELDCDIYLVGAANAGKSTLLNYILSKNNVPRNSRSPTPGKKKLRAGNKNKNKGAVTTSPLPGTTLNFLKVDLEGGRRLYDTPGLLVPGSLTQILTPEELKVVVPKKEVEPLTLRLEAGKCVLIGGLARVALVGDSRPFLFSFFVSNDVKLHQTDLEKSDAVRLKHAGELLQPPLPPGPERLEQMGEWEIHTVDIKGSGWKEAGADIALTGLGWVAVTGAGNAQVQISVPKGIGVSVRPPLMPFDIWDNLAKYTGGRPVKKVSKSQRGKRRGIGRR